MVHLMALVATVTRQESNNANNYTNRANICTISAFYRSDYRFGRNDSPRKYFRYDKTVKIWNSKTVDLLATLLGHTSAVMGVDWSPDDSMLVSGS